MPLDRALLALHVDPVAGAVLLLAGLALARAALVVGVTAAGRMPGQLGRAAHRLGHVLRPGATRRLLSLALGLGLPTLSVGAGVGTASAQQLVPESDARPVTSVPPAGRMAPHGGSPVMGVVLVVPGDTLWDIARRHLPLGSSASDVAAEWPRWYAANRAVIGPDPSLIRPGTRLLAPDRRSTGTSTSSHDRPPATHADSGAVARSLDPDRR
ncbi:MAG TPA: LysM domain-containing protein [Candidatus Angelobacter sp.]|nr:LysM domain-containing protein [Candidatus Angelobacter sp.]